MLNSFNRVKIRVLKRKNFKQRGFNSYFHRQNYFKYILLTNPANHTWDIWIIRIICHEWLRDFTHGISCSSQQFPIIVVLQRKHPLYVVAHLVFYNNPGPWSNNQYPLGHWMRAYGKNILLHTWLLQLKMSPNSWLHIHFTFLRQFF